MELCGIGWGGVGCCLLGVVWGQVGFVVGVRGWVGSGIGGLGWGGFVGYSSLYFQYHTHY